MRRTPHKIVPDATFSIMGEDGPAELTTRSLFEGKSIVLFGVPGAYTPTCHYQHIPGIVDEVQVMKDQGIDAVAVTAVNDIHVLSQWARELEVPQDIIFLADGNGAFAKAMGLDFEDRELGLGLRSRRYSMWVKDSVIQVLNIEPDFTLADVSSAHALAELMTLMQRSHF